MASKRLKQIEDHITASRIMPSTPEMFFGSKTLNRVSFLRGDAEFVSQSTRDPTTRFLLFNGDAAFSHSGKLQFKSYKDIKEVVEKFNELNATNGVGANEARFVLLGIDEAATNAAFAYKQYKGIVYYAVDVTNNESLKNGPGKQELIETRKEMFALSNWEASLVSQAKMYLDWLRRYRFCAGCGSANLASEAGTKLWCSSDPSEECPVKKAPVSNVSFPRTDTVTIVAITNRAHDKLLLGRGKRFPGRMYSTIAGFIEPGETVEHAAAREAWEETGVVVNQENVHLLKTQPWPYPANLMIGCVAYVEFNGDNEVINLGHDPELEDARWFDIKLIQRVLDGSEVSADFFLPPATAIANYLIRYVVDRYNETLH